MTLCDFVSKNGQFSRASRTNFLELLELRSKTNIKSGKGREIELPTKWAYQIFIFSKNIFFLK